MAWVSLPGDAGSFSLTTPGIFRWWNAFNTESMYLTLSNDCGDVQFLSYTGGSQQTNLSAAISWTADTWHHVVVTWQTNEVKLYIDGALVATDTSFTPAAITDTSLVIGRADSSSQFDGLIDEIVIANRAIPADEIRAIYESNAPVFAETSTWHWRSGRNRVFADAEGLWMVNYAGGAVIGAYAGNDDGTGTKSWGGVSLGSSDVLIGDDSRGGYIWWDDSAASMIVAGGIIIQEASNFDGGGFLKVGLGTKDANLDGWQLDAGEIVGQLDGADQVVLNTSGQIVAGAGDVWLDADGVKIRANTSYAFKNALSWVDGSGNEEVRIWGKNSAFAVELNIEAVPAATQTDRDADIVMRATPRGAGLGNIFLENRTFVSQGSTTAALPTLSLSQADVSEEFIEFNGTVSAGNPINTSALGTYYGRVRVSVNGTFKWLALYND